jgi:non-specific serine/threonine protein kinase
VETNHERYDLARTLFTEALAIHQQYDDRPGICGSHYFLAIIAYGQNNLVEAIDQVEAALTIRRAEGPIFNLFVILNALGLLHCEHGDLERGALALIESCSVWQRGVGTNRESLAEWLAVVARLEMIRLHFEQAARLFGAAETLSQTVGVPLVVPPPSLYRHQVGTLESELGTGSFRAAWTSGRAASTADAVVEALKALEPTSEPSPTPVELTMREQDVLRLLALGLSDREIATTLSVSVRTVEGHVARVLGKLGVHTRNAAVTAAISAGLLASDATAHSSETRS